MQWGIWLASALIGAGSNAEIAFGWPRRNWVDMVLAVMSAGCLWFGGVSALRAQPLPSALAHRIGIGMLFVMGGWTIGHRLLASTSREQHAEEDGLFGGRMALWLAQCLASFCIGLGAGLSHLHIVATTVFAALSGMCIVSRSRFTFTRNRPQQQPNSKNDERDDTL
ncbi:hypothetical protein GCM10025858_22790 [Alicyclobacillus sacchari]|uniref:hypothetical protein n=1 Tax=Alicyclobacillus sacchari TaxID=392010 RepID=UPI0023E9E7F4|nr:hypothetical protein [Alicyclobacillus sacchari]GMA57776.1 hypothetical protein GCM10025858_22790 [Alicyclobacillus sacchari]